MRNSQAKLYTQKDLKWSNGPTETLGVKIDCDGTSQCQENFNEIMKKVEVTCRTLTLFGKRLIINSLIGSLFICRISTILEMSKSQLNMLKKVINKFLWKDKRPKDCL